LPDIDYLLHDKTIVVTRCGRICPGAKKINFGQVFAGQAVGISEIHDDIWLITFMDYDLGYFDLETRVLEPLENPFGPKVLPKSPERSVTYVSGTVSCRSNSWPISRRILETILILIVCNQMHAGFRITLSRVTAQ
jgi:hypothetical protein